MVRGRFHQAVGRFLVVACVLAAATGVRAGSVAVVLLPNDDDPDTTLHDVLLTTDPSESVGAMEIYLQLHQGSLLYPEDPIFLPSVGNLGGDVIFPPFPDPARTMLCCLALGASQNLGSQNTGGPPVFEPQTLDAIFAPALGQDTSGLSGFLSARINMTDNSAGFVRYRANFLTTGPRSFSLPIRDGIIGVPEPGSISLAAGLVALGWIAYRWKPGTL